MSEQTHIEAPIGCPFCGKIPTVKKLQSLDCGYKHLVACRNAACPVNPSVTGATLADAIRRWNTRDAKTPDVLEDVMTTTPTLTFPPLTDCDGNPEPVSSVRFAVGRFTIEITTGGAGAYLDMEIDGHAEMNASELTALASWAESACKAMDKHNGEVAAKR